MTTQTGGAALEVAAAAIVSGGRVLAARRTHPVDVAGGWELPGGKVDAGEAVTAAVVREVREELGCEVTYVRPLEGRVDAKPGYVLTAHLVELVAGEPVPHEHDAVRWLAVDDLTQVDWLPADRPFLPELARLLDGGEKLPGGNVAGAIRAGRTVRRSVGPWTPAVHALLDHLRNSGLDAVPRVLGFDDAGREVLEYLPGTVLDVDTESASADLLADAMRWLRRYHRAVDGFTHPGPWRTSSDPVPSGHIVCHHDFAPYNAAMAPSVGGVRLVGVFDWDMAGPGVPLQDLAFAAWNWVPLWRDQPADEAAARVRLLAAAYDGGVSAVEIVTAVVPRIERSIEVMTAGAAAGDPGMVNLVASGAPVRTRASLDALRRRIPGIIASLSD